MCNQPNFQGGSNRDWSTGHARKQCAAATVSAFCISRASTQTRMRGLKVSSESPSTTASGKGSSEQKFYSHQGARGAD